jgi:hypothetical protein
MIMSPPKNVVTDPSGSVSLRRSLLVVISGSLRVSRTATRPAHIVSR